MGAALYLPNRVGAVAKIAANINIPRDAAREANLHHAVVFAPYPYAPPCLSYPARHFVFYRPNNDPDLKNDVLWVNTLGDQTPIHPPAADVLEALPGYSYTSDLCDWAEARVYNE